jgi:hypothetical protein
MRFDHVIVGIVLIVLFSGCAASGVVLKDPKTGRLVDCTDSVDERTKAFFKAAGAWEDVVKQCESRLLKEGWVCVSGC